MSKSDSAANSSEVAANQVTRLDSWKEIAAHLKRDVRTVQRWEATEGLPAHRHVHQLRSSVYAFTGELDQWWLNRKQGLEATANAKAEGRRSRKMWWGAAAALLTVAAAAIWLILPSRSGKEQLRFRPLTAERGMEYHPVFSPDGSKIAYTWCKEDEDFNDVYVRSLTSGDSLQITKTPDNGETAIAWSPDGNWLAFFGVRDRKRWIIVTPALGGTERRITTVNPYPYEVPPYLLCWAPDGDTLIFPDLMPGEDFIALHAVSIRTGERWKLTEPPAGLVDSSPSVASDGTQLAFLRNERATAEGRIFLAPLSDKVRLTGLPAPLKRESRAATALTWIGRERRLAYLFVKYSEGIGGLWTIPVDGQKPPRLLFPVPTVARSIARIAPDGHRLALVSEPPNVGFVRMEITANAWAEPVLRKIPGPVANEMNPSFSPNGDRIAYSSTRSGHHEIWTCRLDGSHPIRISHMDGPQTGTPRWSPDGGKIAFDSSPNFNGDIWIASADGGPATRLTHEPSAESNPSWSVDGKWIYFTSNRTGKHEIWKAPSAGGTAIQITRNDGFGGFESPDSRYFYYGTRYNRPDLRRVPVSGGEEVTLVRGIRTIHEMKMGRSGVYFLPVCLPCARLKQPWELQRYTFATGKVEVVARFRARMSMGLAIAPDESFAILTVYERVNGNIVLVEGLP